MKHSNTSPTVAQVETIYRDYDVVYRKNDNIQIQCDSTGWTDSGVWLHFKDDPRIFIPWSNIMQIVEHRNSTGIHTVKEES